jgi:hypothetical protein
MVNRKYVTAGVSGSSPLIASANDVGKSEKFEIIQVDAKRNYIALRAYVNKLYLSVANDRSLIANQPHIGQRETFEEVKHSDGTLSLKSIANNQFVCAESGGGRSLIVNRNAAALWEKFEFVQQAWS